MLAKVLSGATVGLSSIPVTVEVDVSKGSLPRFNIVGLPSKAVEESKERVRAAIKNSGAKFPGHRITINLAPADLPKEGPSYDLPIAIGILIASGQLRPDITDSMFYSELSLDGGLRHTKGVLPIVLMAKQQAVKKVFVSYLNVKECSFIKGVDIYPAVSLIDIFRHLAGSDRIRKADFVPFAKLKKVQKPEFDFEDIVGQEQAKRALEISASGGHNLFLTGVPGAGKTMLARALPGILPDLTEEEALEITQIYSIAGKLSGNNSIIGKRPFRSPHHTTSQVGLIGGGSRPAPGEISLAHRGVLFLDEFPEYPRHVLEALRQPIEDGKVSISRAIGRTTYPAKFVLVAASNPCPCGYFGGKTKLCKCLPRQIENYQKRVSGPILDRIDMHLDLPAVKLEKLTNFSQSEPSKDVKKRAQSARNIQTDRYKETKFTCNGDASSRYVKKRFQLSKQVRLILRQAARVMHLSARSYFKTIKVARTIADLDGSRDIDRGHIAEALQYRPKTND